jgi:hypothetical protein
MRLLRRPPRPPLGLGLTVKPRASSSALLIRAPLPRLRCCWTAFASGPVALVRGFVKPGFVNHVVSPGDGGAGFRGPTPAAAACSASFAALAAAASFAALAAAASLVARLAFSSSAVGSRPRRGVPTPNPRAATDRIPRPADPAASAAAVAPDRIP